MKKGHQGQQGLQGRPRNRRGCFVAGVPAVPEVLIVFIVLIVLLAAAACGGNAGPAPKVVNIYIWTNYLPLDHGRLPHLKDLDPRFLNQKYDPGNGHSVPYLWGTTGIGYDKTKVQAPVDSWAALFDPRHAGRILMLDDQREVFGAALRLLGRSINEKDPAILRRAAEMLKKQKPLVRTFNSSDFANLLAAGDVDLSQGYNGELAEAVARSNGRLAYVVPKEGGTLWIDNLAIPKGARNLDAAYAFLDFVMQPEIAAKIVNHVHYACANQAALPLIDAKVKDDPSIYPPQDVLNRCELIEDLGETTQLVDRLWTEVKAQ